MAKAFRTIGLLALASLAVSLTQPFGPLPALAEDTATPDASLGQIDVSLDLPKDKPYVGEMIMLRMRSFIHADVVLDKIIQPSLTNFSWQQLGTDKPIEAMINGFSVDGIERDIAIYPSESGRLIIEPFTRAVTIVNRDGQRVETTFQSRPVYVDVQTIGAVNKPGEWWLPARSVNLTETWSQEPDEIKPGTLARRTVTVEALGLTGDRLPPPPDMRAAGTIAFRGPVDRTTTITDDGPLARGTYVWDLRPVSSSPAQLPAIHVNWFDTRSRRLRDNALPALWVALVGTLVHPSHEKSHAVTLLSSGPLAAAVLVFVWGATFLASFGLPRVGGRGKHHRRCRTALRRLNQRARAGDLAGFVNATFALSRLDPVRFAACRAKPHCNEALARVETALFGQTGSPVGPSLPSAARTLTQSWRALDRT